MNPKKLIIPAIILGGTLLLLAMYFPGLRPERPATRVVEGAAAIGGAFTLVDQKNNPVSSEALKGKFSLVYFGFTNCPDICPLALSTMTQALDIAGPVADDVIPVFITVDPERDTVQVMADYVANFHPRFLALTGTPEQVREAASAYRVYFKKAKEEAPDAYMMDHSGFVYLMDRTGAYMTHFKPDATAEQIAARLRQDLDPRR
jgi:cytochrome oxidase Cu insertion factor (SCO1/SenC/PrrC family)